MSRGRRGDRPRAAGGGWVRGGVFGVALALAVLMLVAGADRAEAQGTADILAGIRNGGGWVSVPIVDGVGVARTATLPAMGIRLEGCAHVWPGHSGTFEIEAHESVADTTVVMAATPGEGVTFRHTFGMQAQLDFVIRWSEPRDTTLMMWVGLAVGKTITEACEPHYGG